jgi:hypothetical protein
MLDVICDGTPLTLEGDANGAPHLEALARAIIDVDAL